MAASRITLYNKAIVNEANGLIDFASGDFAVVLLDSGHAPDPDTHDTYSDVSGDEITGTGYTAGGIVIGMTVSAVGPIVTVAADTDPEWTAATFAAKYAVIVQQAGGALTGTDLLIGYTDLDEGGGSVSVSSGTLKINLAAAGIMIKDATIV